jgi:hypothetical protein
VTVSTILRAELSRPAWSYDFSRMRIFCPAMDSSALVRTRGRAVRGLVLRPTRVAPEGTSAIRTAVLLSDGRRVLPGMRDARQANRVRRASVRAPAASERGSEAPSVLLPAA